VNTSVLEWQQPAQSDTNRYLTIHNDLDYIFMYQGRNFTLVSFSPPSPASLTLSDMGGSQPPAPSLPLPHLLPLRRRQSGGPVGRSPDGDGGGALSLARWWRIYLGSGGGSMAVFGGSSAAWCRRAQRRARRGVRSGCSPSLRRRRPSCYSGGRRAHSAHLGPCMPTVGRWRKASAVAPGASCWASRQCQRLAQARWCLQHRM
jgi:hypothetical protein